MLFMSNLVTVTSALTGLQESGNAEILNPNRRADCSLGCM